MRLLSSEEATRLELNEARRAALTYSNLAGSMARQYERLERKYQELFDRLEGDPEALLLAQEALARLREEQYGHSSEKRPAGSRAKGDQPKKERTEYGRKAQPGLPLVEVVHELPVSERQCSSCGGELEEWPDQFETSELIQIVPMRFVLERHKRRKYRCSCGKCIKTAPGPLKLKEGSRYSVELAAEVGVAKYGHHIPLERQVKIMGESGLDVDGHTLFGLLDTAAWLLRPHVYEKIGTYIRGSPCVHIDETHWKNLGRKRLGWWDEERRRSKKRKGPGEPRDRFCLWGMRSRDAVYFRMAETKSGKIAAAMMAGVKGSVMCDGSETFNAITDGSPEARLGDCWAHVRRKFIAAEQHYGRESRRVVRKIRWLYRIEKRIGDLPREQALAARERFSKAVTDRIYKDLLCLKPHRPKSDLGKAVRYALHLWEGLTLFIERPELPLDNNAMERAIRGPVIGRKNHYGSKNIETAEVAAIWYTVVETAKACGLNPRLYVGAALREILQGKTPKLPWEVVAEAASAVPKTAVSGTTS